jgi:hypothetical protein
VRAENPPATKFIYALCHCGQLIGRRAVGLQGGSGSRAPSSWAFLSPPLATLVFALHQVDRGDGPASSQTRASPAPYLTQTVTATLLPPHAAVKLQASRPRAGGAGLPTARPMGHGQLGDRGPACSAAFRHLRSVFGASQDPGSMPPNVFDLFWRVLGANHFWRSTSTNLPQFCLLSFMIPPVRSSQGPCKQRARKQVRSMQPS